MTRPRMFSQGTPLLSSVLSLSMLAMVSLLVCQLCAFLDDDNTPQNPQSRGWDITYSHKKVPTSATLRASAARVLSEIWAAAAWTSAA